eukprot:NODE_2659_length_887_cov_44.805489_g2189_i0.p1 GENE.NODE_2659_length_887_cov_44.805489_g2189_i0~~NODE_2659_length_887_cov_44.805489_g2189_i0.p1  ORF type:complete len:283 (-),score=-37.79 NODE_2659_length_887_cov_44.805489_g2189_i0:37-846(-)
MDFVTNVTERPLLFSLTFTSAMQFTTYLISATFQFDYITDFSGSLNFILVTLFSLLNNQTFYTRQNILTSFVLIWGIRLGTFLLKRVLIRGHDARFNKIRINKIRFAIFFIIQALWVFITTIPVILINTSKKNIPELNVFDYIGFACWIIGFLTEAIADHQKHAFNLNKKGRVFIADGIWKYSRYPNYFGEILLWSGIFISSIQQLRANYGESAWGAIISPIFTYLLLVYVSGIRLTDKRYNRLFKGNKQWEMYKKTTPRLIPWFPSKL